MSAAKINAVEINPHSREEIISALNNTASSLVNFFGEMSPERYFLAPKAGKWGPDGHLRHLTMVLERVGTRFAAVPSAEAKTLPGRSYPQLRDDYRAALEAGGKAPAAFLPAPAAPTTEAQASALHAFQTASHRLAEHLNQPIWTETALDSTPFAHPLLNQISAREMLFFTVYHNLHHLEGARNSMEQA